MIMSQSHEFPPSPQEVPPVTAASASEASPGQNRLPDAEGQSAEGAAIGVRIRALHVTDPVFCHHLYEYERGVRELILHTTSDFNLDAIRTRLTRSGVEYEVYPLQGGRSNIFFGSKACVDVVRAIAKPSLPDYTPEEDFILGIMLGYSRAKQCERFLKIKSRSRATLPELAG